MLSEEVCYQKGCNARRGVLPGGVYYQKGVYYQEGNGADGLGGLQQQRVEGWVVQPQLVHAPERNNNG